MKKTTDQHTFALTPSAEKTAVIRLRTVAIKATIAQFNEPADLAIIGDQIYIADTNNHRIMVFELDTAEVYSMSLNGL